MHPFRGIAWWLVLAATGLAGLGVGFQLIPPPAYDTLAEPPAAAAFLAAYAWGNEADAERVASPLYAAEWERRGLEPAERRELLPRRVAPDGGPAPWIAFAYAGAAVDAGGFQHLFYAASGPACEAGCRATGVWRVDAEPSGAVIWAELVWLFGDNARAAAMSRADADLPRASLPGALLARDPRTVVAVRSASGPEGYYAVTVDGNPQAIVFFAVGPGGEVRPGAWSYGRQDTGPSDYGKPPVARPQRLPVAQEALVRSYLASLP